MPSVQIGETNTFVEFPDDFTPEQIQNAFETSPDLQQFRGTPEELQARFGDSSAQEQVPVQEDEGTGFFGAIGAGFVNTAQAALTLPLEIAAGTEEGPNVLRDIAGIVRSEAEELTSDLTPNKDQTGFQPGKFDWWMYNLGSGVGSIAPAIVSTIVSGGLGAPAAASYIVGGGIGAMAEAQGIRDEALARGATFAEANAQGAAMGLAVTGLQAVGVGKIARFGGGGGSMLAARNAIARRVGAKELTVNDLLKRKGIIRRGLEAGAVESVTEAAEEPIGQAIQGLELFNEDVITRMLAVGAPSFFIGAALGGLVNVDASRQEAAALEEAGNEITKGLNEDEMRALQDILIREGQLSPNILTVDEKKALLADIAAVNQEFTEEEHQALFGKINEAERVSAEVTEASARDRIALEEGTLIPRESQDEISADLQGIPSGLLDETTLVDTPIDETSRFIIAGIDLEEETLSPELRKQDERFARKREITEEEQSQLFDDRPTTTERPDLGTGRFEAPKPEPISAPKKPGKPQPAKKAGARTIINRLVERGKAIAFDDVPFIIETIQRLDKKRAKKRRVFTGEFSPDTELDMLLREKSKGKVTIEKDFDEGFNEEERKGLRLAFNTSETDIKIYELLLRNSLQAGGTTLRQLLNDNFQGATFFKSLADLRKLAVELSPLEKLEAEKKVIMQTEVMKEAAKKGTLQGVNFKIPGTAKYLLGGFAAVDFSTGLHELSHFISITSTGKFRALITKGMKNTDPEKWTRDQHESFARGFEAFLLEGKAPKGFEYSHGKLFNTLRENMEAVYENRTELLDGQLNEDLRAGYETLLVGFNPVKTGSPTLQKSQGTTSQQYEVEEATAALAQTGINKEARERLHEELAAATERLENRNNLTLEERKSVEGDLSGIELDESLDNIISEEDVGGRFKDSERRERPVHEPIVVTEAQAYNILKDPENAIAIMNKESANEYETTAIGMLKEMLIPGGRDVFPNAQVAEAYKAYGPKLMRDIDDFLARSSNVWGRLGNALRTIARNKKAIQALKEQGLWSEELAELLTQTGSMAEVQKVLEKSTVTKRTRAMVMSVFYNSLLSNPTTLATNALGSFLMLNYTIGDTALRAGIDKVWSKITGSSRTTYSTESLKLFTELIGGAFRSKAAIQDFKTSWLGNKINVDELTKTEEEMGINGLRAFQDFVDGAGIFELQRNKAGKREFLTGERTPLTKKLFKMLGTPTRFMMATDRYFKHIAQDVKRQAVLERFATIDKTKPREFAIAQKVAFVKQQFGNVRLGEERFEHLLKGVMFETSRPDGTIDKIQVTKANVNELLDREHNLRQKNNLDKLMGFAVTNDSVAYSEHITFQNQMGESMRKSVGLRNSRGVFGRWIIPFMATQGNLIQRGIELTPVLGAVSGKRKMFGVNFGLGLTGQQELTPQEQGISTASKQIQSAIIMMIIWQLVDEGAITGPPPENKAERDAFFRSGKVPNAFKVGDTYISYNRLEPFSFPFSLLADLKNQWQAAETDEESMDKILKGIVTVKNHLVDSSYMRSIDQALGGQPSLERMAAWSTGGLVPYGGFWRFLNAQWQATSGFSSLTGDVNIPDRRTFVSTFGQNIPSGLLSALGYGDTQDPKLDVFGQPVTRPTDFFQEWLPIKYKSVEPNLVEEELQAIQLYPGLPSRFMTTRGERTELSDEHYTELVVNVGLRLKEAYTNLMKSPGYKTLNKEQKVSRLERIHRRLSNRERDKIRRELLRELVVNN